MTTRNKKSVFIGAAAACLFAGTVAAAGMPNLTDTDGDGVISAEEINAQRAAYKEAQLAQFDTDGNGELSRMERRAMKDARYDSLLQTFDSDGDGELSREERRDARDARRAEIEAQLDVNGDGEVSEAEAAGFEEVKESKGKKRDGRKGKRGGDRA